MRRRPEHKQYDIRPPTNTTTSHGTFGAQRLRSFSTRRERHGAAERGPRTARDHSFVLLIEFAKICKLLTPRDAGIGRGAGRRRGGKHRGGRIR
ncbi:hypothetical protein EVAR_39708_1 [Eumeta japonica]|uniref:Uncharacterized protein n=1 Tax=Eumeta variegata TaxID=151549 RepID=A0A4C1W5I6_EUMVA|nr:hypothetical protein EVAR_39708_1 [Eumeta japonica]